MPAGPRCPAAGCALRVAPAPPRGGCGERPRVRGRLAGGSRRAAKEIKQVFLFLWRRELLCCAARRQRARTPSACGPSAARHGARLRGASSGGRHCWPRRRRLRVRGSPGQVRGKGARCRRSARRWGRSAVRARPRGWWLRAARAARARGAHARGLAHPAPRARRPRPRAQASLGGGGGGGGGRRSSSGQLGGGAGGGRSSRRGSRELVPGGGIKAREASRRDSKVRAPARESFFFQLFIWRAVLFLAAARRRRRRAGRGASGAGAVRVA